MCDGCRELPQSRLCPNPSHFESPPFSLSGDNAGGFLAFGLGDLPPMRQFGALAALAFLLSMLADFTALPAALWILFRARPDVDHQAR